MEPKKRKKLEALVYKHTHRDFRGSFEVDGIKQKSVLRSIDGQGTCLVLLSSFTDEDLVKRLPLHLQSEWN
jgi:hypothetical protein